MAPNEWWQLTFDAWQVIFLQLSYVSVFLSFRQIRNRRNLCASGLNYDAGNRTEKKQKIILCITSRIWIMNLRTLDFDESGIQIPWILDILVCNFHHNLNSQHISPVLRSWRILNIVFVHYSGHKCPIAFVWYWSHIHHLNAKLARYSGPLNMNRYACNKSELFCYSLSMYVQWGSEIRPSLDFEWSKTGWVANGLDFEWDLKSRSPTIGNPDKWPPFC